VFCKLVRVVVAAKENICVLILGRNSKLFLTCVVSSNLLMLTAETSLKAPRAAPHHGAFAPLPTNQTKVDDKLFITSSLSRPLIDAKKDSAN
jgi:hypothetical protein